MPTLKNAWPVLLVLSACSGGGTQKADVDDKVTSIQSPHTKAECEELAKAVAPKGKCGHSIWFSHHLGEINTRIKELESFTPERSWLVHGSDYNHLLNAISPTARAKWLAGAKAESYGECPELQAAYCRLAVLAEEKIPLFQPNTKAYPNKDSGDFKLMKGKIKELSAHSIFYMGIEEDSWLIEKNGLGIPTDRYKHGMAWVRFAPNDHPFCRIYYINLIQDYSGGGSYGDTYANFVDDVLVGCPK
ncbi:MAG: hypothetical protein QM817_38965 [Archangium sp.]